MSHDNFHPHDPHAPCDPLDQHSSATIHDHDCHFPPLRGMLTPATLMFGTIDIDEASSTQTITLTNTGTRPLPIIEIKAVGPFTATTNAPVNGLLPVNESCQINVFFRPTQEGAQTGGVYVNTGDAAGSEFVSLIGAGSGDGSGSGSGTPTGPAGGDLTGFYPNPVLRVPRATTQELAEGLSNKANSTHTHTLAQIAQSGANIGDVVVWSGTNFVPGRADGTPSSGTNRAQYRIVVVTDSTGADQGLHAPGWPTELHRLLRASGVDAEVYNLGINGMSFNIANTTAKFGALSTVRQRCIDLQPNIIICALGYNDGVRGVGSRSTIEMQNDALQFFTTVKSALPAVKIFYGSQLPYDNAHSIPSSLQNKHVMPVDMQRRSTGILAGCWCSEILDDATTTVVRNSHSNWLTLDSYIKSLPEIDGNFTIPLWKAARLGLLGYDGLHPTAGASKFYAAAARQAFITLPGMASALPGMSNQNYDSFNDPEVIFNSLVLNSGSEWATRSDVSYLNNHTPAQGGPWNACLPASWYMPSKGNYQAASQTNVLGTPFTWNLNGCYPLATVYACFDELNWVNTGARTDNRGDHLGSGDLNGLIAPGSYPFRYRIGDEIHGPVAITFVAGTGGSVPVTRAHAELNTKGAGGSVTAGGQTLVPLTNSNGVALGGMVLESIGSGNYRIKVPRAGTYQVCASSLTQITPAGGQFLVVEIRNAAGALSKTYQGAIQFSVLANYALGASFSRGLPLSAGDSVTLRIWSEHAGTFADGSQGAAHWLTVTEWGSVL